MAQQDSINSLYDSSVVIDALNVSNWDSPAVYRSLHDGGVNAINATITVWENYRECMDNIKAWLRRFRTERNLVQARSVREILDAKEQGNVGVVFGWQNASPIENDLDRLALFHALGVRIIQVTYNERNLLGNGCYERTDEGLSRFGVDAVREMNRLGILIDLSHVGDRTTLDAAELSEQPVACTHANARTFFDHVRNKTDDALGLIAERGGVIGANAFPPFLRKGFESTLDDYVDAIDDLVERVGVDHVGIGTDFTQDQAQELLRLDILPAGHQEPGQGHRLSRPAGPPGGHGDAGQVLQHRARAERPRIRGGGHHEGHGRQLAAPLRASLGRVAPEHGRHPNPAPNVCHPELAAMSPRAPRHVTLSLPKGLAGWGTRLGATSTDPCPGPVAGMAPARRAETTAGAAWRSSATTSTAA